MDGNLMARHVVQELKVCGHETHWEDRNEYYDIRDAITSRDIDQKESPEKLFRVATIRYN